MKIIGLVGGLGPEATLDYYNSLINAFKNDDGDLNYPEIIIYSVNMSEFIGLMNSGNYDLAIEKILEKTEALKRAGADFAAITANTPHIFFDELSKKASLPLVSVVEATMDVCRKKDLKRAGLLGTKFTMNASFYPDVFSRNGIEVVMPDTGDIETINQKLFTEIELGIFRDDTRSILISIIEKMVKERQIDSIILGCTELPLILKESSYAGIPALNTTRIHVDAITDYCRS